MRAKAAETWGVESDVPSRLLIGPPPLLVVVMELPGANKSVMLFLLL